MNSVLLVFLALLVASVSALPPYLNHNIDLRAHSLKERTVSFRYIWIDQSASEFTQKENNTFEIAFTSGVSNEGERKTVYAITKMVQYMPSSIFETLCQNAKSGVFTRVEKITSFPEYAQYVDTPACSGRCDNECSTTCTFDGRKYDTLAGVGGVRGVAVDDNILCNSNDPYYGYMNVLVHELAHTINGRSLSADLKDQIEQAYNTARGNSTWTLGSYAMANSKEYFAEATGVFFHTDKYAGANGGMSRCFGKSRCTDEAEGRAYLQNMDPQLFSVLNYIYTDNTGALTGITGPCLNQNPVVL